MDTGEIKIINGDCLEVLKTFPDNHFDSVVTDPPYGLSFMGKKWDHQVPSVEIWREVFRVLKPGGHMLVACGTRTQHRMAVNIEDAGFEIRDVITWHYGSGFPKSLDVSKAIDKYLGKEREVIGKRQHPTLKDKEKIKESKSAVHTLADTWEREWDITAPNSQEAKKYNGYGTALKPATEFWTLARKPLDGTIAQNVLKWGVGGLRINDCRVSLNGEEQPTGSAKRVFSANGFNTENKKYGDNTTTPLAGRFPANVIFDGFTGALLDEQTPVAGTFAPVKSGQNGQSKGVYGNFEQKGDDGKSFYGVRGGASRFFYCAKASKTERNKGLDNFIPQKRDTIREHGQAGTDNAFNRGATETVNHHPTVKPVALMRYLVRLISPPLGTCLDPFAGSCSTGIALKLENMNGVLIEREKEYCTIGRARIAAWQPEAQIELDLDT